MRPVARGAGLRVVLLPGVPQMPAQPDDRWMPARLALVRTHTRLWDQAELQCAGITD